MNKKRNDASIFRLFTISLRDMLQAYPPHPFIRGGLAFLFALPALRFAVRLASFNRDINRRGLRVAAEHLLGQFYHGVTVYGEPPSDINSTLDKDSGSAGLLVLANHPGVGDSLALLSILERDKVRLVAAERDFFYALPALLPYLILVPEDPARRSRVIRAMLDALKRGETVVLYPAGEIERDPFLHPEQPPLKNWSAVIGLLIRMARDKNFDFTIASVLTANVIPAHIIQPARSIGTVGAERQALLERRAVGSIIGLGAAKKDNIALLWGYCVRAAELPEGSAAALTSHIMDEVSGSFHRVFPVRKAGSFFQSGRPHTSQTAAVGS